jgi:hypothetical protein
VTNARRILNRVDLRGDAVGGPGGPVRQVLTSLATTAKPLPASPALAASLVALSASRLVCPAIPVVILRISPISALA